MSKKNKYPNLSIYLGQSNKGIGIDGSGKAVVGGGEQYLSVSPKLNNANFLKNIKNLLSLDSLQSDQLKLKNNLESWSYFTEGNLVIVCRLVSAGSHGEGNRDAYFSHARVWTKSMLGLNDFDPGLYIGSSSDFEKPWRDEDIGVRIPNLSSMKSIQDNIVLKTITHKGILEKYLSYLFYGLLSKKKIIIIVPINHFHIHNNISQHIALIRALLPAQYRNNCNIRIYASEMFNIFIQKMHLLVVPDYLRRDIEKYKNILTLDINGNCIHGQYSINQNILDFTNTYAENALKQFYNDNNGILPYFSQKSGNLLKRYTTKHQVINTSPDYVNSLVNYSFEFLQLILKDRTDKEKYTFLRSWGRRNIDWNVFLSERDLSKFRKIELLKFILESFQNKEIISLQSRIIIYLSSGNIDVDNILQNTEENIAFSKYYERVNELSKNNSNKIVTELLIFRVFGHNLPDKYIYLLEKQLLFKVQGKNDFPKNINVLLKDLNTVLNNSNYSNNNILLQEFIGKLILRDQNQVINDIVIINEILEPKNFNYFSAYLLQDLLIDNNTDEYTNIIEKTFSYLHISCIDQEYLQNSLIKLLEKDFIYKKHLFACKILEKITRNNRKDAFLEKVWFKIKSNFYILTEEQISQLFDNKFNTIGSHFLLNESDKIEESLLESQSRIIIKNREICKLIDISQLMEIILILDKDKVLETEDLIFLSKRIDSLLLNLKKNNLSSYNKECSILENLLNKKLWLAWRKETKLNKTHLSNLSLICITQLSKEIKTLEIWDKLIYDFKQELTYTDIKNKEFITLHNDLFIKEQFKDIVNITGDYSTIFKFHEDFSKKINYSILSGIIEEVRGESYFLYLSIYNLYKDNHYQIPNNKCINISEIDNLLSEKSNGLIKAIDNKLPKIFIHNVEKCEKWDDIKETISKACFYNFHKNHSFFESLKKITITLGNTENELDRDKSKIIIKILSTQINSGLLKSISDKIKKTDKEIRDEAIKKKNIPLKTKLSNGKTIAIQELLNKLIDNIKIVKALSSILNNSTNEKELNSAIESFYKNDREKIDYLQNISNMNVSNTNKKYVNYIINEQHSIIKSKSGLLLEFSKNPMIMVDISSYMFLIDLSSLIEKKGFENDHIFLESVIKYFCYPLIKDNNFFKNYYPTQISNIYYERLNIKDNPIPLLKLLILLSGDISNDEFKTLIEDILLKNLENLNNNITHNTIGDMSWRNNFESMINSRKYSNDEYPKLK